MLSFPKYQLSQNLATDPLYQLVFIDEFDSLGLNGNRWKTGWEWGPNLFNTNKLKGQCNSPAFPDSTIDIAFVRPQISDTNNRHFDTTGSGYMRMFYKREFFNGYVFKYDTLGNFIGTDPKPYKFTASMVKSHYTFKYGYFEIKYRLKNVPPNPYNAYGPNFWMWNFDTTANYSEIDIFEQNGTNWTMGANIHYRRYPNKDNLGNPIAPPTNNPLDTVFYHAVGNATPGNPASVYGNPPLLGPFNNGAWHTVGLEWTPDFTDFYYDSNDTVRRYANSKIPVSGLTKMPLVVDCYVPAFQYCIPWDSVQTQLPFYYDVDYVKVYQQKQDCTPQVFLNTNSGIFQSKVYQSLIVGGAGGSAFFNSGNSHLSADQFVLLDEGFEVSGNNTTVIISTRKCQPDQGIGYNLIVPGGQDPNAKQVQDLQKNKNNQ